MKIFQPKYLLLVALLAWTGYATAATYYFSTSAGDDSRSFAEAQNQATPWRSMDKFNEIFTQLQPGDAVLFKSGEVFYGGLYLNRSGSDSSPIIVGAYGTGSKPVISGFTQVTQWTSIGNGIYESNALTAVSDVNMVVINNTNYAVGRYPNATAANAGYLTMNTVSDNTITSQALPASPDWDGGQLVLRSSHWTFERKSISNHSGTSITFSGSTIYDAKEGYGFFVQRHISTLDQFGEWYYNTSTKKIAVYFGAEAPGGATVVKVSTIDVLGDVKGSDLTVENLSFEGANRYTIGNNGHNVDRFTLRNCDITYSGTDGVFFQGADFVTLEDNKIHHSNNCGVKLFYSPDATLRNNNIQNSGMQAGMGGDADGNYMGILSEASGFVAEYNDIINTGYTALRMGVGANLLKNNYINTFCAVLDDGAGIYAYNSSGNIAERKITGNIILNGIGANPGTRATTQTAVEGIYLDDNARDIEVSDNTVAWCGSNGIFVHNVQNFILRGNTLFNNTAQFLLKSDGFGSSISGANITENIYFSKQVFETVFNINSDADDISSMGTLNSNYYVRPLFNQLPILVEYKNSNGVVVRQPIDLEEWRSTFGHGQQSKKSPVDISAYTINGLNGGNKLPNEGFNNDIGGLWCFSAYSDCDIDWASSSVLGTGGALQISGPSPSRIGMACGALGSGKQYIIRFSAAANQMASMEVYFMEGESPWEIISPVLAVQLGTEKKDYELLITAPVTEASGTVQFQFGKENTTYWLDNIQMYEANVAVADPDDYIRFEYNPTQQNRSFTLNDSYVDGKNEAYSGTVTLAPYESVVLIKTGNNPLPPDEDEDGVPDAEDQCPGHDDTADNDMDGVPNGCDVCTGYDDSIDTDGDDVPDGCDLCLGFDDGVDTDLDGIPDGCDDCLPITESICPSGDCPVNGNPISADTYDATQRITSTGKVMNGGNVIFRVGERIELKPGFSVAAGGNFQATIVDCPSPAAAANLEEQAAQYLAEIPKDGQALGKNNLVEPEIRAENTQTQVVLQEEEHPWKIYPNPVSTNQSELNIEFYTSQTEVKLAIIDQFGRTVSVMEPEAEAGWNQLRWNIAQLPAGIYYLYHANAPALARRAYPFVVL